MYDTYLKGNTFLANGSKLPKHKGFVFNSGVGTSIGFTAQFVDTNGNTLNAHLSLQQGANFFPTQFYSISGLSAGVTGFMLN